MRQHFTTIKLQSKNTVDFIDITEKISDCLSKTSIKNGCVVIYSKHTTSSIRINENEKRLAKDMKEFLEKLAPREGHYLHDDIEMRPDCNPNERLNGHAHLKNLLLNSSEFIPVQKGKMVLGR